MYAENLVKRIDDVCRGHLAWVLDKAERPNGYFSANYWVTGTAMPSEGSSWKPENALTDTAFQLVKVSEFDSRYSGAAMKDSDLKHIRSKVPDIYQSWTRDLQNRDKRQYFAWPKRQTEVVNIFRLDDHIWIWKALKSVEDLSKSVRAYFEEDPLNPQMTSALVQKEILNQ